MRFTSLGGVREIGASCHLLEIGGKKILLDAGVRPRKSVDGFKSNLPDFERITQLDAICISHAHLDHVAALPLVMHRFRHVPCFMTVPTFPIMTRVLFDVTRWNFVSQEDEEAYADFYSMESIERMADRILTVKFDQTFEPFRRDPLKITFKRAGHILGAAGIMIESEKESAFYTGDFCSISQRTLQYADFSRITPDLLITETTYGDRDHMNRQQAEKEAIDKISTVLNYGGSVLFPTFALGRAQEIILAVQQAQAENKLPPVPIFIDGLAREICDLYEEMVQPDLFYGKNRVAPTVRVEDRETRSYLPGSSCIIVSSSGHLVGGPSVQYAKRILPDSQSALALTAYADEGTVAGQLGKLKTGGSVMLDDQQTNVAADIIPMYLSAHADKTQLLELLLDTNPKHVVGVHGDVAAGEALEAGARTEGWKGTFALPGIGETVYINE